LNPLEEKNYGHILTGMEECRYTEISRITVTEGCLRCSTTYLQEELSRAIFRHAETLRLRNTAQGSVGCGYDVDSYQTDFGYARDAGDFLCNIVSPLQGVTAVLERKPLCTATKSRADTKLRVLTTQPSEPGLFAGIWNDISKPLERYFVRYLWYCVGGTKRPSLTLAEFAADDEHAETVDCNHT
jgi:hypothetical protein